MTALDGLRQFPSFVSKHIQPLVQFDVPQPPCKSSVGKRLPEYQIVKRAHTAIGAQQIFDTRVVRLFQPGPCSKHPCPPMLLTVAFQNGGQLIENLHELCSFWSHSA